MEDNKLALCPGATLTGKNQYTIVSVLGKGGYGITYLAQSTIYIDNIPHQVQFALKEFFMSTCCTRMTDGSVMVNSNAKQDAEYYKKEFRIEAEHLKDLNKYPGIVPVNEVFEANGTIYYVMQHLGNTSLSSLIEQQGKLNEQLAMELTSSIGQALNVLHQKKMTHLDVKPDNVMLVNAGSAIRPVLIDFGLSRHYNFLGNVTNDHAAIGVSDGYSPVEQYVGIEQFSPSADVYALAATLFHMLTGHKPARATEVTEAYLQKALQGKTSAGRINAIARAMQRDAVNRTQSISELLSELGLLAVSTTPGNETIPINPKKGKNKIIYMAGAAVVVVAIAVGAFLLGKSGGEKNSITINDTISVPPETVIDTTTINPPDTTGNGGGGQVTAGGGVTTGDPATSGGSHEIVQQDLNLGYGIWKGGVKNGKPHGHGTLTYTRGHRVDSRDDSETEAAERDYMTGEMVNGHWDYGTLYSASGSKKATIIIGE